MGGRGEGSPPHSASLSVQPHSDPLPLQLLEEPICSFSVMVQTHGEPSLEGDRKRAMMWYPEVRVMGEDAQGPWAPSKGGDEPEGWGPGPTHNLARGSSP